MKTNIKKNTNVCSICGKTYKGMGNNAFPFNMGRCCNKCNDNVVIPLRIMMATNPDRAAKFLLELHKL